MVQNTHRASTSRSRTTASPASLYELEKNLGRTAYHW